MTVTMVGAISAKGVLSGEPEPMQIAKMRQSEMVFYLTNLREVTIKGRKDNPDRVVYDGDVLNIDGEKVGTVRLDTPGVMNDVETLVAHGAEIGGIPEEDATELTYGPLKVVRTRRVYHLDAADED